MPTLTPNYRGSRPVAYAAGALGGDDGLAPTTADGVREAIRQFGISSGWHRNDIWGGMLNSLTRETPEMRRKYPEMYFREPSIKSPLLSAIWSVASLDLQVIPADKKNKADREIAEAYRYALLHAEGGLPQTVTEILLPARVRGEGLCHVSLRGDLQDRGQYRGKRLIHAVKSKPPHSYQLRFDPFANLIAVRDNATLDTYPPDEFIFYKWLSLEGSPGVSDLRACVRTFESKDAAWKLRGFYLDKLQGGFLHALNVPSTRFQAMRVALEEARSGGFIMTEPGVEIQVLDIAMGSEAAFKSFMEDCDREMMVAIGGSHLPFSEGQGGQPRGNTQVQREVSSQSEWKMAADVGYHLSRKARIFVDENYAGADYPEVQLGGGVDPAVIKEQLDAALIVNQMKPISKAWLTEISGVPDPDPNDPDDAIEAHPEHPTTAAPPPGQGVPGEGGDKPAPPAAKGGDEAKTGAAKFADAGPDDARQPFALTVNVNGQPVTVSPAAAPQVVAQIQMPESPVYFAAAPTTVTPAPVHTVVSPPPPPDDRPVKVTLPDGRVAIMERVTKEESQS